MGVTGESEASPEETPLGALGITPAGLQAEIDAQQRVGHYSVALPGPSDEAWTCFVGEVQGWAEELAEETARLEQAERAIDGKVPEITSTMVKKAQAKRTQLPIDSTTASLITRRLHTATFVSALGAGVQGSYLHSTWQWVVFTILSMTALGTYLWVMFGRSR